MRKRFAVIAVAAAAVLCISASAQDGMFSNVRTFDKNVFSDVEDKCGLSKDTVKWLWTYKFSEDLFIKLAEGIKK